MIGSSGCRVTIPEKTSLHIASDVSYGQPSENQSPNLDSFSDV